MRIKGKQNVLYLPMVELMFTVITAGNRGENVAVMQDCGYECFCTLLMITVA